MTDMDELFEIRTTILLWKDEGWFRVLRKWRKPIGIWLAKPCPHDEKKFLSSIAVDQDLGEEVGMVFALGDYEKEHEAEPSSEGCFYMLPGFDIPDSGGGSNNSNKWWQFWK